MTKEDWEHWEANFKEIVARRIHLGEYNADANDLLKAFRFLHGVAADNAKKAKSWP